MAISRRPARRRRWRRRSPRRSASFSGRIAEEARRLDQERRTLNTTIGSKVAGGRVSEARQAEWRDVLRGMSREERVATVRGAAAGKIPAADEILATLIGSPSPLLCGFREDDLALAVVVDEHRQRLAGPELAELGELDHAEALGRAAAEWIDDYAVQLLDGDHAALRDAQAALRGHLRLDELSAAQKARRVAETTAAGVTGPDALYRPADGEDDGSDEKPLTAEDVAAFAGKPLSDRMQAAEPGLPPEEAIRRAMRD